MKTMILCGGYGTRIRDVSDDMPKPMITIGGFPILWHIMKYYAAKGYSDFVLCLGYKSHVIKDFFLNYKARIADFTISLDGNRPIAYHSHFSEADWTVTCAETGLNAMTGARVRRARHYLAGEENFMLTYGDGVGDIDIDALIRFHVAHGRILTLTGVRPPSRFGELERDSSGRVTEFNEKPQSTSGIISGGFMVCRKELFDYLDDTEDLVLEKAPMERLVKDGQMMMYEHRGFWQPMDTYRDYKLLNDMYAKGSAPWVIW
jgi:glucose-1-phosphate cytidylyltransferase